MSFPDLEKVAQCQLADKEIVAILQKGMLPDEGKEARRIVLESKNFEVVDGVFDPVSSGHWCVVVPKEFHVALLEEAHQGHFAGHLDEKKVYDRLRRLVW